MPTVLEEGVAIQRTIIRKQLQSTSRCTPMKAMATLEKLLSCLKALENVVIAALTDAAGLY